MERGKILVSAFILLVLINFISAIEISEVELNPSGNDVGGEWIEIHSEERVELGRYRLVNNDGKEILLSGGFQGYFLYIFGKQWLDNTDERVFLYEGDNLVDETPVLEDSANDEKTWQLCSQKWEFLKSTKNRANDCATNKTIKEEASVKENASERLEENQKNEVVANEVKNLSSSLQEEINNTPIKSEIIKLNAKTIKSNSITKIKEPGNYAIYVLILLGILLGFLFFLRRRKYKNEFRK